LTTKSPSVDEVIRLLDRRNESEVGGNEIRLQKKYGLENLVAVYVGAFSRIKNWAGRMHIMFWLQGRGRGDDRVIEVARRALRDRSRIVRNYACGTLAFALDLGSIPHLEELLTHKDESTRADAAAAIDAIRCGNHHYFADRNHTGKSFWHPGGHSRRKP